MDWDPLLLSLEVSVYATVLAGVVGIALGAVLASPRTPGRDLWDALLTAPMVLPPTVLGYYLLVSIGRKSTVGGLWFDMFGRHLTFTFAVERRKAESTDFQLMNTLSLVVVLFAKVFGGWLSDKVGRRKLMIALTVL